MSPTQPFKYTSSCPAHRKGSQVWSVKRRQQELQIDILNFIMRGAAMLMIIWWGSMMIGYVLCFSCGFNWPIDCEDNVSTFT